VGCRGETEEFHFLYQSDSHNFQSLDMRERVVHSRGRKHVDAHLMELLDGSAAKNADFDDDLIVLLGSVISAQIYFQ